MPVKTKKDIIRIHDRVKVINPTFVLRWGYENNWKDHYKVLDNDVELQDKVRKFIRECGIYTDISGKITGALAYGKVHDKMHSGAIRQLFTKEFPEYVGRTTTVWGKKVVQTGKYNAASGGYDYYYGCDDYDPAYLSYPKTHVLLNVSMCGPCVEPEWIEECNVEKIKDE